MSQHRQYNAEFKQEAVELARSSSSGASQIARDIGVEPTLPNRWCREAANKRKSAFQGSGTSRDQELAALKLNQRPRKTLDYLSPAEQCNRGVASIG